MRKKTFMLITLVAVLMASLSPIGAWAADKPAVQPIQVKTQPINLVFDGQKLKLPEGQHSFIYQARTYVPIRYISYALQQTVGWDAKQFMVSVQEPTKEELAELKKELQLATGGKAEPVERVTLPMKPVEAKLVFNGKEKALPKGQQIFIYKGSIYVPLRFLSESVGSEIGWDDKTRTVTSESKAYREAQSGNGEDGNGEGQPGEGGVPGEPTKLTYEQITASAESRLNALRNSCRTELLDMAIQYLDADDAGKIEMKKKISQRVDSCTTAFESVLTDVSGKLTDNGYSTDIIAEYREAFQAELEAGKKMVEDMS